MTDEQLALVFGRPEFMTEFFEDFAQALFLAVDEEIMGDDDEIEDNEDAKP